MQSLFWIALFASVGCVAVALTDLEQWEEFKQTHGKHYPHPATDAYHYAIFQQSLKEEKVHNAKCPKLSYSMIDTVSDITQSQWPAFSPILMPDNFVEDDISKVVGNKIAPDSIDWREKGYVTLVKYQGDCGDCWLFSSIGALEALYKRKSGKLEVFSEQNLRDCFPSCPCYGGNPANAFDFVAKQQGGLLDPEKYYPRSAQISTCKFDKRDADNTTVVSYIQFSGEDKLKKVVGTVGPVVAYMTSNRTKFMRSFARFFRMADPRFFDPQIFCAKNVGIPKIVSEPE